MPYRPADLAWLGVTGVLTVWSRDVSERHGRKQAWVRHQATSWLHRLGLYSELQGFDASRVLLPTLHDRLREYLGSPFAAGIPNRDILLCFRNEPEVVDNLRKQIATDYQNMPHQVTDKLLLVTQDGLAPLD